MPDKVTIQVDLTEFHQAMREYVAEARLTVAEAVNKQAIELAFNANRETKRAQAASIPAVSTGLFHALASARPGSGSAEFQRVAIGAQRKLKKKFGGRVVKGSGNLSKAADFLRSRRTGGVNYSKSLWLRIASQLGANVTKLKRKSSKINNTSAKRAKESGSFDKPVAEFTISGVEKRHVERLLQPALESAVPKTIKSMQDYVSRKLRERAAARSGK